MRTTKKASLFQLAMMVPRMHRGKVFIMLTDQKHPLIMVSYFYNLICQLLLIIEINNQQFINCNIIKILIIIISSIYSISTDNTEYCTVNIPALLIILYY